MSERAPRGIDVTIPNVARIYDYMLGGKDNFAADREAAQKILKVFPEARDGVRHNRQFVADVVTYLAREAGIRQFVDIGAGLPTQSNVHEVAREAAPDARVVYVDNDPVVCVHGRALLASTPSVAMLEGDLTKTEDLCADIAELGLIDWNRPLALLLVAVAHFIRDPFDQIARLRELMAPGSHLVITHLSSHNDRLKDTQALQDIYRRTNAPVIPRGREEMGRFFGDFEMLDLNAFLPPSLVARFSILGWAGVARKPG